MDRAPARQVLDLVGEVMGLLSLQELCRGLLEALRRAVPSDFSALNEVPADLPQTLSMTDPPVPPAMHHTFARLAMQNPLVQYYQRTGDGRATRFSDVISPSRLQALDLYREVYGPLRVEHQIAFMLPSFSERMLGVTLSRSRQDFSDAERDLLNLARPYLIQAYRNAVEHTLGPRGAARLIEASDLEALGLTKRQAEVLRLVAMGNSDQDAAARLGIGVRTAQKHLERCYRRLQVNNRSEAAQVAWSAVTGSRASSAVTGSRASSAVTGSRAS